MLSILINFLAFTFCIVTSQNIHSENTDKTTIQNSKKVLINIPYLPSQDHYLIHINTISLNNKSKLLFSSKIISLDASAVFLEIEIPKEFTLPSSQEILQTDSIIIDLYKLIPIFYQNKIDIAEEQAQLINSQKISYANIEDKKTITLGNIETSLRTILENFIYYLTKKTITFSLNAQNENQNESELIEIKRQIGTGGSLFFATKLINYSPVSFILGTNKNDLTYIFLNFISYPARFINSFSKSHPYSGPNDDYFLIDLYKINQDKKLGNMYDTVLINSKKILKSNLKRNNIIDIEDTHNFKPTTPNFIASAFQVDRKLVFINKPLTT